MMLGVSGVVTPMTATLTVLVDRDDPVGRVGKGRKGPASSAAVACIILHDIGRNKGICGLRGAVTKNCLSPVELVVAESGNIEAHGIKGPDDRVPLLQV